MRGGAVVLVVGVVSTLLTAPPAAAHVFVEQPGVAIRRSPTGTISPGSRVLVFGRVRSDRKLCKAGREVFLFKRRPGPDRRIGVDVTDAEGEYLFVIRPKSDRVIYVRLPRLFETSYGHSHDCLRARSSNLSIDVA